MSRGQRGWVEKLPSGRWSIQWRDDDGRRVRGGTYALKRDATLALSERVASHADTRTASRDVTLDELVARFLSVYEADPSTVERVTYQLGIAQRAFGSVRLRELSSETIAAWRPGLPEGSRYQIHATLSMAMDHAIKWRLLSTNPCKEVRNPAPRYGERAYFTSWADVEALDAELGHYVGAAIFAVGTGLRPGEWTAVTADDIDIEGRALTVRRMLTKRGELREYLKTERSRRRVPLRQAVIDALPQHGSGLLWATEKGKPIEQHNWRQRHWRPALEASGLWDSDSGEKAPPPYAMRHTYAAMALAAGIGMYQLARRMGTSSVMIDRHYGHLLRDQEDAERELLDAWDAEQREE